MDEEKKKGMLDNFSTKQTFLAGIVGGFLVLCTIGFGVMLAVYLKGGFNKDNNNGNTTVMVVKGPKQFSECLDTGKTATKVGADTQLGGSLGVSGTPATFVNGYLVSGALPYESIKQLVDTLLADKKPSFDFLKDEKGNLTPPQNMPELPDAIWRGNSNAKVTLVEFADFECPYCAVFSSTVAKLVKDYGDQIKYTYRHFPLSFHPSAQKAAETYECAKEQGKGWEMYDKLYTLSSQKQLGLDNFKKAATELGLK
jgi:protein-disulfide isomerase